MLSDVCDLFGCVPSVARQQDWREVLAITEYRAARDGFATFNQGVGGMQSLIEKPAVLELLVDIWRAQAGQEDVSGADLLRLMSTTNVPLEDDE